MESWLTGIRTRIADGSLLPAAYYAALDCDAALDARDRDDAFDTAWCALFERVGGLWSGAQNTDDDRILAEDIRREAFLAVSTATGQHEIAGQVSDDLDLIVRSRLVGVSDPFLVQLWSVYERGRFPSPRL